MRGVKNFHGLRHIGQSASTSKQDLYLKKKKKAEGKNLNQVFFKDHTIFIGQLFSHTSFQQISSYVGTSV